MGILDLSLIFESIHTISDDAATSESDNLFKGCRYLNSGSYCFIARHCRCRPLREKLKVNKCAFHTEHRCSTSPSLILLCLYTYLSSISLGCSPPSKYSSNEIFELISESIIASMSAPLHRKVIRNRTCAAPKSSNLPNACTPRGVCLGPRVDCGCAAG